MSRSLRNILAFCIGVMLSVVLMLAIAPAYAATVDTNSNATSNSTSGAQTATNVNNALTIQTEQLRSTTIRTAPGSGLAATTNSFSSDYCGGTAQVGASAIGWSLGASKQAYDKNCQALRRVEKFGQLSAHASNIGLKQLAYDLTSMAAWELCSVDAKTAAQCLEIGIVKEISVEK